MSSEHLQAPSLVLLEGNWHSDWSWSRLMEILIDEDSWAEARRSVMRYLLGLQVWSFRQLFDALDDPERPLVSWRNPFLQIRRPMPAEWDNEVGPSGPDLQVPQRDLFVALSVLTAGVAVQEIDCESSKLLKPRSIERYLSLFSPGDARRFTKVWRTTGPEWINYGDEFSPDGRNLTLRGRGRKGTFSAALRFQVSPRIIELDESTSFHIRVGLPCRKSKSLPRPDRWTDDERRALRETVLGFLRKLMNHTPGSDSEFHGVRTDIADSAGTRSLDSFEASVESADGAHYLSKVAIKPFSETVWSQFPRYTLGIEGPSLPITNGRGELLAFFESTIMATMLFPTEPKQRAAFIAHDHLRCLDEVGTELEEETELQRDAPKLDERFRAVVAYATLEHGFLSLELIRALRGGASADELRRTLEVSLLPGLLVGEMLLFMIQCGRHHPEHAGMLKATYLVHEGVASGMIQVPATAHSGDTKLRNDWARYKSAAHLWAALKLELEERWRSGTSDDLPVRLDFDVEFLAKAEELRRLGEECFAQNQKVRRGPVLDPTETWRSPRDLELPREELETHPLPEWCLDLLSRYQA